MRLDTQALFWQGDGKYCGWRWELDEFLTAGIYGTDGGERENWSWCWHGKQKQCRGAHVTRPGRRDCFYMTVCFSWVSHLPCPDVSSLLLIYFLAGFLKTKGRSDIKHRADNGLRTVWLLSQWLNDLKCFRLNPSLPELCGPSWSGTVPKKGKTMPVSSAPG